jgi:peptidoglycan L-alanyl-D-glutamate endopeptidase CwlK
MLTLGDRSLKALVGVHPDLVRVILRAAAGPSAFIVTDGVRTKERQAVLVASGKSRTMNSRHLPTGNPPYGHAVDLAVVLPDGTVTWERQPYKYLSLQVKAAAVELGVALEWGGECFGVSFIDSPHFQLTWRAYPLDLSPPNGGTNVA